jgi:hypothetical protein
MSKFYRRKNLSRLKKITGKPSTAIGFIFTLGTGWDLPLVR